MIPPANPERYEYHRFPGEIISYGVWLSYRFSLSSRDVEELLLARGIVLPMRPSATGVGRLDRITRINYGAGARSQATNGVLR